MYILFFCSKFFKKKLPNWILSIFFSTMTPIFKCLICRKDIERSTKTFWIKKGHLLCSTCLDNIDKKSSKSF